MIHPYYWTNTRLVTEACIVWQYELKKAENGISVTAMSSLFINNFQELGRNSGGLAINNKTSQIWLIEIKKQLLW